MSAPRLLLIVRGAENYGVATELLSFARSFVARGWDVTVYALGTGGFVDAARAIDGVALHIDPHAPMRFVADGRSKLAAYGAMLRGSAGFVRRLRGHVAANRYDAMIFCEHGLVLPIAAALTGKRLPGFWLMPNIVSGQYPGDLNRRLYAAAFAASGMIPVANSAFTRKTLGRAGKRAATVELGVDPALFPVRGTVAGEDRMAGLVPAGGVRLAVVARLVREKGALVLTQALAVAPDLADVHLIVCGGPTGTPYEAELRETAARAGMAHRLHLVGPVDDAPAWHRSADVVAGVRIDPEPFGLSVVEAMLSGTPVLAHALGGPGDIVVDGATGWMLADMEAETVVAGLRRMLADRARWAEMGAAGRTRALEHYTVDAMTDRLLTVMHANGVTAG